MSILWQTVVIILRLVILVSKSLNLTTLFWLKVFQIINCILDITLLADLPGLTKEDVTISLNDNVLCVEGERKKVEVENLESIYLDERFDGKFKRTYRLPINVDPEQYIISILIQSNLSDVMPKCAVGYWK